jgi:diacylglycerol kinase
MIGFGIALCAIALFIAMASHSSWIFLMSIIVLLLGLGLIVLFEECLDTRIDALEKRIEKQEKKFKDCGLDLEGDIYD